MTPIPRGDPACALAAFVGHLRGHDYPVGTGEMLDALRLAEAGALADRALLRGCLKPLLACTRPQAKHFDRLFDAWWDRATSDEVPGAAAVP